MDEAWERLIEMGLPDGAPWRRDPGRFDDRSAREALEAIDPAALDETRREVLLAWLEGYRQHWPDRWRGAIGPAGDRLIEALDALPFDPNRYLKLRRIAIAHLAQLI